MGVPHHRADGRDEAWAGTLLHVRVVVALVALVAAGAYALIAALPLLLPPWALAAYLARELAFVGFYAARARELNQQPEHEHLPDGHDAQEVMAAFMRQVKFFKITKGYVEPWFNNAPLDSVLQGNMLELLAYGFFYKSV